MRHLTYLFLLSFLTSATAQSSFPLPEDDPSWVVKTASFWQGGAVSESIYRYGDVINHCGYEYIEVLQEFDPTPTYLIGYIRIEGTKVYALHDSNLDCMPGEALMYDFSLENDITTVCGYNMSAQWNTTSVTDFAVESTFTQEIFGVERNIQQMEFDKYPGSIDYVSGVMYWAEGLGSSVNPFYSLACIGDHCEVTDTLYQVYFGDDLVYENGAIINDITLTQPLSFQVYPTIFSKEVSIQGEQLAQSYCRVFDSTGRVVYQSKLQSDHQNLSLEFLQPGMYFVVITDSIRGKSTNTKKIIKQ